MKMRPLLALTLMIASAALNTARAADDNPLLKESTLPFQYPPFDKIKNEDFQPAIEQGMAEQLKEMDAIAKEKEKPTFENTIVPMEKSGRLLQRAYRTFSNLNGCNTNPQMQEIDEQLSPKLAAHNDAIHLNPALFARVETLYNERDKLKLDPESNYLLERYYKDFVRAGAKLSDADKEKLKQMNQQIASLQTKFEQNVLQEKNASSIVVDHAEQLEGLPPTAVAAAKKAADEDGKEGKFAIRLQNTSDQPPLASLKNRELRQRIMETSLARNSHGGEWDNRQVVLDLVRLRAQRAVLLGYPNHAAYQLEDQTAKNVPTVNKLLADVTPPAVANARKEIADMQKVIDEQGDKFKLESWDWDFYSEQVRKAKYNFDESQLRPYLELNHVLTDGVFYAANKEYGITFKERKDLPVYLPDVRVWEVANADGTPLAIFIGDYYARPSKRGGAWASAYVSQNHLLGTQTVVANHLNIPKPPEGQPTLLTWDETKTAFHEFGHALHAMFSNVKYPRFSGTSVPRDFVEYPSQVNEMWRVWPEVLKNYARHYQTGETIPQELVDKVLAADKFNQGYKTTEQVSATLLDQSWHQLSPDQIPNDVLAFEASSLKKAGTDLKEVPPRYRTTYFSHIFSSGYSAGYYSYVWSEVLDADTVAWFKEHGGLTRANGDRFRTTLLSRGGSEDAMNLFRNMIGRDPYIEPLLERRGLAPEATTR